MKFDIQEASDGKEAVSLVQEVKPDVVIMDAKIPKMDGIQATGITASIFLSDQEEKQLKLLYSGGFYIVIKNPGSISLLFRSEII
jgi:CheY-like chemotaxis protein